MDDAQLVEAIRSGDDGAWATVYDRYADKLHDHCHRLLHDRHEAADALHDAFIKASHNLHQLRDPSRLRPWLYSICRHEALRRARQRSRFDLTDEIDDMRTVEVDLEQGTSASELQELVWAAAAGLNERDQALLDLNLRQGLEGQDLADAMGTSLNNSYVLMSRLRDQVERSLGALLIARMGREDCEELDQILAGWDGRFTPLLRKRVARHVDGCDVCSDRRAAALSPLALLAAAPLVPAPSDLRDRVLEGIRTSATSAAVPFNQDGFAVAPPGTDARRRPALWRAAAVAALVAVVAGVLALVNADDPQAVLATGDPETSTTTTVAPTTTTTVPPTTTSTTAPLAAVPTTQPETQPPTTPPSVAPPPTPAPDTTAPRVGSLSSSEEAIRTASCVAPFETTIAATVEDSGSLTSVVLSWTGPPGSGQTPMTADGDTYAAQLPPDAPFETAGDLTYTVTATDAAGNTASRSSTIQVQPCPG